MLPTAGFSGREGLFGFMPNPGSMLGPLPFQVGIGAGLNFPPGLPLILGIGAGLLLAGRPGAFGGFFGFGLLPPPKGFLIEAGMTNLLCSSYAADSCNTFFSRRLLSSCLLSSCLLGSWLSGSSLLCSGSLFSCGNFTSSSGSAFLSSLLS